MFNSYDKLTNTTNETTPGPYYYYTFGIIFFEGIHLGLLVFFLTNIWDYFLSIMKP